MSLYIGKMSTTFSKETNANFGYYSQWERAKISKRSIESNWE